MPKIERKDFIAIMKNKEIDVNEAEFSALNGADPRAADLNGDGKIRGSEEMSALFSQIDTYDYDWNPDSIYMGPGGVVEFYSTDNPPYTVSGLMIDTAISMAKEVKREEETPSNRHSDENSQNNQEKFKVSEVLTGKIK